MLCDGLTADILTEKDRKANISEWYLFAKWLFCKAKVEIQSYIWACPTFFFIYNDR